MSNYLDQINKLHSLYSSTDLGTPSSNTQLNREADYDTGSAHAEALNRVKLAQRLELAKHIVPGKTIIEMFAGRGNLTRAVYEGKAKRHILIEYNKKTVEEYLSYNTEKLDVTIFQKSNLDFCTENLPDLGQEISCVDFDAFGTIVPVTRLFFANFKVKKKLVIGITDGTGSNLVRISRDKDRLAHRVIELGYPPLDRQGKGMNIYMMKLVNTHMERLAKKHGLKFKIINSTHNRKSTVYCGYVFER